VIVAVALALAGAGAAHASPDADETSSSIVSDPAFGAFTAVKTAKFFREGNPEDPFPGDGANTYVYTLSNDSGSGIGLIGMGVQIPGGTANAVIQAGVLPGSGTTPSETQVLPNAVQWNFFEVPIHPGEVSAQLFIVSTFDPGTADLTVNGDFGLDAPGVCGLVPVEPPAVVGTPNPCTIGFWKNREQGKKGLLQFFPDGDFDAVKAEAVSISSVFASEAELVEALTSKGARTIEERARQQLSALVLNLASGTRFPDNTKCRLFFGNELDTDGDGVADLTVGAAFTQIESDILSGDPALQEPAKDLADDINNGIGVLGILSEP
jgi:hypothetical protein